MPSHAKVELTDDDGRKLVWQWEDWRADPDALRTVMTYLNFVVREIIEQFGYRPSLIIKDGEWDGPLVRGGDPLPWEEQHPPIEMVGRREDGT